MPAKDVVKLIARFQSLILVLVVMDLEIAPKLVSIFVKRSVDSSEVEVSPVSTVSVPVERVPVAHSGTVSME